MFVQQCAPKTSDDKQVWYYYCNRAGIYKSKGNGQRQMKKQGTSKMGEQCTAHMRAEVDESGIVSLQYCFFHHNHETRLAHLRLSTQKRIQIANKLHQGITMERILDDIRDTVSGRMNREHLTIRQDLHNIRNQYNIEGVMRHSNDLASVSAWVYEMSSLPYNSVVIFKQQGAKQDDDMDNISDSDFVLGIQTEFQRDMLKQFGASTICVDTTHGTNMYDFNLLTVVVLDEYGEGIPVAWMLSNREDSMVLIEFFKVIKQRVGSLSPSWFMSDDAEQFFTAWRAVFGDNETKKLLCAWHVDRAWRRALREHIPNKSNQIETYHQLRLLLTECEEQKFRLIYQHFITYISLNEKKFFKYFHMNYNNRPEQWASAFRPRATVNTNMFLEAFHKVLKTIYRGPTYSEYDLVSSVFLLSSN